MPYDQFRFQAHAQATPWFWGVNGAAGVLAAGLAVACSIAFSIDTTIRIGRVCYLILIPTALLLMADPRKRIDERISAASQAQR